MNIMRHHSARAVEPEPLVHPQVIGSPRKEARYVRNFLQIFIEMRLQEKPVMFAQQRLANFQHGLGSGKREARRNRVLQAAVAMEALDQ